MFWVLYRPYFVMLYSYVMMTFKIGFKILLITWVCHSDYCAGVYSVGCACDANITFGFEIMLLKESPRNVFRFLKTGDIKVDALDGILMDHACLFEPYL